MNKETSDNEWGEFFNDNPEKVLGTIERVKGKFGEVTITKSIEGGVESIDAPEYRGVEGEDATMSEVDEVLTEVTITNEEVETTEADIEESKSVFADLLIADEDESDDTILWTFDEIDEKYNKGISDDEKTAYIYYIEGMSGKEVSGGFEKYRVSRNKDNAMMLMQKGVLFYDTLEKEESRRYQPRFLYQSGSIYDKQGQLTLEDTKEFYIREFGEEIYEMHVKTMQEAYEKIWAQRISLDAPEIKMRIKLVAISEIAKNFMVDEIINTNKRGTQKGFNVYTSQAGEKTTIIAHIEPTRKNSTRYDQLNLPNAFLYWLYNGGYNLKEDGIIFRDGIDLTKIAEWYIGGTKSGKGLHPGKEPDDKAKRQKQISEAKENGERLFGQFLAEGLPTEARRRLELVWNAKYNGVLTYNPTSVPIGFVFNKFFEGASGKISINTIRVEKREALGFSMVRGSSLLAYGVSIGKTFCAIFIVAQNLEMGLCKRPIIVVPNQVYNQFRKTIAENLPQYKINALYNCRGVFEEEANNIEDGTISICTYQGLERMGFSDDFDEVFIEKTKQILFTGEEETERKRAKKEEGIEETLGQAKAGASIFIDNPNINFDYLVYDEAHNAKKVFTAVKGDIKLVEDKETGEMVEQRSRTPYQVSSGTPSAMAIKLFYVTQYIQAKNPNGNCLLLTATPFTNNPLEVYSMLALINYNALEKMGFGSIKNFFDIYANVQSDLVVNTRLSLVRKQVFFGWNNVIALQNLIFRFIDKKGKEDEDKLVERPNKIILPIRKMMVEGKVIELADKNTISTTLNMTEKQKELSDNLILFAEGQIGWDELTEGKENIAKLFKGQKIKKPKKGDGGDEVNLDGDGAEKARVVLQLTYSRMIALSPYFYPYANYQSMPTASEFVESSTKLLYVFECIKSVQKHHKDNKTPMSGQVVYMDIGTMAFPLMMQYAITELGFKEHEVGSITGGGSYIGKKRKEKAFVQNSFLGQEWIEDTQEYKQISDEQRLKILFGSSSIKEGINLQNHASVLYNCYLDWNPTDNVQLEGRIWRQGNKFGNVRIVIPMVENSIDVFMFQKLQEKTERINQIWQQNGKTNEIDTSDLDAKELKYELLTDPEKIAILEVDDLKVEIDEKIDNVNYEVGTLKTFKSIYLEADAWMLSAQRARQGQQNPMFLENVRHTPVGGMYSFLQTFRPDLVPLKLFTDATLALSDDGIRTARLTKPVLNYSPEELIEKMVTFHKEKKIGYPEGYTYGWNDGEVWPLPIMVGDEVEFDTKKGRKKGVVSVAYTQDGDDISDEWSKKELLSGYERVDNNPNDIGYQFLPRAVDIMVGENETEDVNIAQKNVSRIEAKDKTKKEKEEKYEPFTWGTKEAIERLADISLYQSNRQVNSINNQSNEVQIRDGMNKLSANEWGVRYPISRYLSFGEPTLYFHNRNTIELFNKWLGENKKWVDFVDQMKSGTNDRVGYYTSYQNPFYSPEYPVAVKKIAEGEVSFLKSKGIKNRQALDEKIEELTTKMNTLEQEQKDLLNKENIAELVQKITYKQLEEKESGLRRPSGYKDRAKEFIKSNADYLGNEYLDIAMPEKLDEGGKKSEESEDVKKERERREGLKAEVETSVDSSLKKRLMGITMLIKIEKDKAKLASLKKRKKGFQLLIKMER